MNKILILSLALILIVKTGIAQNVGIGTNNPDPSALLHINTTEKGFLLPRLTNAQMNAVISPASGLMIYNLDEGKFYYYNGTAWTSIDQTSNTGNNLQEVTRNDSITTHDLYVGDTTSQWTLYGGTAIEQTKKFANTSGLVGASLQSIRTEKYNADYAPYGKMGGWNRYITRNWYNANGRPGEVLTRDSYNTNSGGGAILLGEGAWSHVLESDWNRVFEDYVQISLSTGYSYRPFAMYMHKDLEQNDITFRGHIFHVNPVGVAEDFLNVKNGKLVLSKVLGAPSEVSNTLFSMVNGVKEINLINNTQSLLFTGGTSYAFDNTINPMTPNTIELGVNSSRWKKIYTNALVASYVTVDDADYSMLATDHTLNFKNITSDRDLVLVAAAIGSRLEVVSGQNLYKVTFQGVVVKNSDGSNAIALPPGKSCTLSYDGQYWWVVAVGAQL